MIDVMIAVLKSIVLRCHSAFCRHGSRLGITTVFLLVSVFAAADLKDDLSQLESELAGKKLDTTLDHFDSLFKKFGDDTSLLYNLGLYFSQTQQHSFALAVWRKQMNLGDASDKLARSIQFSVRNLPQAANSTLEPWDQFRASTFGRHLLLGSIKLTWTLFCLVILAGGVSLLNWVARKRIAKAAELDTPPTPKSIFLFLFGSIFFLIAVTLQISERLDSRATVIRKKASVLSAANPQATQLFDLFEGTEVFILDSRESDKKLWRRIQVPGGMAGWIAAESLFGQDDSVTSLIELARPQPSPKEGQ